MHPRKIKIDLGAGGQKQKGRKQKIRIESEKAPTRKEMVAKKTVTKRDGGKRQNGRGKPRMENRQVKGRRRGGLLLKINLQSVVQIVGGES